MVIVIVLCRLEGSGVKRGHAFGDIGDSLGGRAKLRLIIVTMRPMVMIAMVFVVFHNLHDEIDGTDNLGLARELARSLWRITFQKILRSSHTCLMLT